MRFYYISIISVILLVMFYLLGTGLLAWLGSSLRKTYKRVWPVMVPLFLVLYIGPVAEELWVAWNFGQLCRKDAGIFIFKTVEVEGFYDATRPTSDKPWSQESSERLGKSGYKFYEMPVQDFKAGPRKVAHIEKVSGVWTTTFLDQPTARYHYRWPHMSSPAGRKIVKGERLVVDSESGEVLGRYLNYAREAPWFFVGLDSPKMGCREKKEDELRLGTVFGPSLVLIPKK